MDLETLYISIATYILHTYMHILFTVKHFMVIIFMLFVVVLSHV